MIHGSDVAARKSHPRTSPSFGEPVALTRGVVAQTFGRPRCKASRMNVLEDLLRHPALPARIAMAQWQFVTCRKTTVTLVVRVYELGAVQYIFDFGF